MNATAQDPWAQWLLQGRDGDNPETQKTMVENTAHIRDAILHNARIAPGDTVLDVGCGYGPIAFGTLSHVGEQGKVIFCDVSQQLLERCHAFAHKRGVLDRCQFLATSADDLSLIETNSVDVVTTRAVLIYVKQKHQAIQEFYRVLKPKGRLSIFEPIPQLVYPEPPNLFYGYNMTPILSISQKLHAVYDQAQPAELLDFGVQDLLQFVKNAGFSELYLALQVAIVPDTTQNGSAAQKLNWEAFLQKSRHPLVPIIQEMMHQALTVDEAEQFTSYLRPLVEAGQKGDRSAAAYLWAMKPEEAIKGAGSSTPETTLNG